MKFFTPGSMLADNRDKADLLFIIASGRSEFDLFYIFTVGH
jgi:hypothetical protein